MCSLQLFCGMVQDWYAFMHRHSDFAWNIEMHFMQILYFCFVKITGGIISFMILVFYVVFFRKAIIVYVYVL